MKFRISPAAVAVFLAAGFFNSGLRAASAPAAIPFENDAAFTVTLSNTNPSKVIVDGELITSISGPTGACDQSTTDDGALILSPLIGQNFTLFIQTDRGSSLSLNVRPQPGSRHCQQLVSGRSEVCLARKKTRPEISPQQSRARDRAWGQVSSKAAFVLLITLTGLYHLIITTLYFTGVFMSAIRARSVLLKILYDHRHVFFWCLFMRQK